MTWHRIAVFAATAGAVLLAGTPLAQAQGPSFAGVASAPSAGVPGAVAALAAGHQAPPSIGGPAHLAFGRLRPTAQSRYHRIFSWRSSTARGAVRQAKPEDTLELPPAGAPAAEAISSSGSMVASYVMSYCATPRGVCNLVGRPTIGDKCWCVVGPGRYVNGTVE
jgi:hypothetical protein